MTRKVYIIENLDCANCAAKIEAKINALPEVQEATITFATRPLRITAADPDALLTKLTELAQSVEPEVFIHPREEAHHDHEGCGCGHHHDHGHEGCGCGHHHDHGHEGCACGHHHDHGHEGCSCGRHQEHSHEKHGHEDAHDHGAEAGWPILVGGVLFGLALLLERLGVIPAAVLGICIAAYGILGGEILRKAWKNLKKGLVMDENFLMSVASIGAFFIGNAPEGVGVMLFYRVGEYFEHKAVERSRSQIMEAVDLRPEVVHLTSGETIPATEARVGDLLTVRPGDRIPLDGIVVSGESRIDTAPITGEPVPVRAAVGDRVISGCVNTTGQLTIQVEKPLAESMVTRILDSVENAAASKPKIDRFITRFARIYTPVVVALAAAVAIIPSIFTGNWSYWVYTALSFLVMSCPCALVLSVPLAFFAGIGTGSKKGILFKGGLSIEALGGVKGVILDKTGTITRGDFKVQEVAGGHELLALCASCEQDSTHPIAQSIVEAAKSRGLALASSEALEEIPGRGIRARMEGKTIFCGNATLLEEAGVPFELPDRQNGTLVLVAVDGVLAGWLRIADTVKEGAAQALAALRKKNLSTAMLTGDGESSAQAIGTMLGIDQVHSQLLPGQKLDVLRELRAQWGPVMYVGDGINDAPVLAGADVGAAMGTGADAAIEAADVVFMTSDVGAIPEALDIAWQTQRIAWQNVVFALLVKFLVMALGLLGHASMWMAVFADSGVAMLCVLNSIRLLYRRK